MFKAIIFDCDGVLVDSEVLSMRGSRTALKGYGLDYSAEEFSRRFIGLHDGRFYDELKADYRAAHGRAAPDDFVEQLLAARRAEMPALTAVAGAAEALQVHECPAVASSSRAHFLENKLKRTGLYDFAAPHVYSADLVEHGKPAPDIFLYTAQKIGIAPQECVVLEDSANGVRAGLAAGMTVWGFVGGGHCDAGYGERLWAAGAHTIISDFSHFAAVVKSIQAG